MTISTARDNSGSTSNVDREVAVDPSGVFYDTENSATVEDSNRQLQAAAAAVDPPGVRGQQFEDLQEHSHQDHASSAPETFTRGLRRTREDLEAKQNVRKTLRSGLGKNRKLSQDVEVQDDHTVPVVLRGLRKNRQTPKDVEAQQLQVRHFGGQESHHADAESGSEDGDESQASASQPATADRARAYPTLVPRERAISPSGLVEATPVLEESTRRILMQAVSVPPEELELQEIKQQKEKRCKMIGCVIILVAASVGVILGAVLGIRNNKPASVVASKSPAVKPTMAPTMFPSSAPTGSLGLLLEDLPVDTLQNLNNRSTPQGKAHEWLSGHSNITHLPEWRKKQLFALATFYYAFEGPNWPAPIRRDWMDYTKEECLWFSSRFGLFQPNETYDERIAYDIEPCNNRGEFQLLLLANLKLSDYKPIIPPEISLLPSLVILSLPLNGINTSLSELMPIKTLQQMPKLTELSLYTNSLLGTIPSEVGLLSKITSLSLGSNALSGPIPSELGLLSSVELLYLYINSLSGTIPRELGMLSSMRELNLFTNSLSGTIPSELGVLSSMTDLVLYGNSLSGTIPSQLGLLSSIAVLYLYSNSLLGPIPSELGLLSSIEWLSFDANALSGTIPSELGLLSNATQLYLYSNSLSGTVPSELGLLLSIEGISFHTNALSGTIPSELGLLSSIELLSLYSNSLSGTIPSELGFLSSLEQLQFSSNSLSGTIPSQLGLLSSTEVLHLYNNTLSGTIPSELGLLLSIEVLYLDTNTLTGTIPSELGLLPNMEWLYLYENTLSGTIPIELGLLSNMKWLLFHSNSLSETIPTELGLLTTLEDVNLGSTMLTGFIPSEVGLCTALQKLDLSNLSLSGSIPLELGLLVANHSLKFLDTSSSLGLTGTVPENLCFLRESNCSFLANQEDDRMTNCSLDFDCTRLLCGCDCVCSLDAERNITNATETLNR